MPLPDRELFTREEQFAFRHVREYLHRYKLFAVAPPHYRGCVRGLTVLPFPKRYFGSIEAHTALLLSRRFYRAFLNYDYILVHHLDALVFRDALLDWCDAGYDYIGPPWLVSPDTPHITEAKVGNGGFSLRRVRSFLRVLDSPRYFVDPSAFASRPRRILKRFLPFNDVHWHIRLARRGGVHEDRFWAEYARHYDPAFRIAPVEVALRFAFEAEPRRCFERIGRQMPFGCHRWQRFDGAFYEPYLLCDRELVPAERVTEGQSGRSVTTAPA
jgi:hypothetical protein